MEFEKLDPHCEEVANTYDVYGSLKPEPYYDFLSEKMQIPQNYDDLIRFFICKRILPIMCNELNRTKYNSYRMWPMPYHKIEFFPEMYGWDEIEKEFPTFKKFVQKKKIDYDALAYWNYGIQLDCKAMQNYLALIPMLMPICIKLGLKMFYHSHQVIDHKLSGELYDQMFAQDLEVINGVANWNELGKEGNASDC